MPSLRDLLGDKPPPPPVSARRVVGAASADPRPRRPPKAEPAEKRTNKGAARARSRLQGVVLWIVAHTRNGGFISRYDVKEATNVGVDFATSTLKKMEQCGLVRHTLVRGCTRESLMVFHHPSVENDRTSPYVPVSEQDIAKYFDLTYTDIIKEQQHEH